MLWAQHQSMSPTHSAVTVDCNEYCTFSDRKMAIEFDSLCKDYTTVVLAVRRALEEQCVSIDALQGVIYRECGLLPLPAATVNMDKVFQRLAQYSSCFEILLLQEVTRAFVKSEAVKETVKRYSTSLQCFKSSTLLEDISKTEGTAAPDKTTPIKLELCTDAYKHTTMYEFDTLTDIILHRMKLTGIHITRNGPCTCISWTAGTVKYYK